MSVDIGRIYTFSLCRNPHPEIEHVDKLEDCQRLGCPVDVYHDNVADRGWALDLIRDHGGVRYVPAGEGLARKDLT